MPLQPPAAPANPATPATSVAGTPGTALVTGASMGIGLELARVFAGKGHSLVLVARSESKLNAIARELGDHHRVKVTVVAADLTDPTAPAKIEDAVSQAGITVDYLVNNAGFGTTGPFVSQDLPRQLEMIQVNITALVDLTHRFARGMAARRRGGVLNVASTAAFQPGPNMAMYYATKAFVLSFTEALAEELRRTQVRVSTLCPGPVATGFAETAGNAQSMLFRLGAVASPLSVARDGYAGLMGARPVAISGLANWLGVQVLRFSPRWLVRRMVAWMNSSSG